MHILIIVLAIVISAAKAGDFYTTYMFLKEKTAVEGNPVSVKLMNIIGVVPTLILDWIIGTLIGVLMAAASWDMGIGAKLFVTAAMCGVAYFFIRTVINNAKFLK